uniref:Cystatin domain-containing protein n=1 Tax=Steinernema glaseri TaxID=37863 RepID=A0A1I8AFK4_9BILA
MFIESSPVKRSSWVLSPYTMKTAWLCVALLLVVAGQLPGGWRDADPYSKVVQDLAWQSVGVVNEYHENDSSSYYLVPAEVTKAEYQIVAGVKYRLTVKFSYSDCDKQNLRPVDVNRHNCPPNNCLTRVTHRLLAWIKPWQNFTQITVID